MTDFDAQVGRAVRAEDDLTQAQSDSDAADLAGAVQGLAGLVAQVDDLDATLAEIAGFALAATPNADGVGVTLIRPGDGSPSVLAWAVTDLFVREIDHLQYEVCLDGPCLTAMQTRRPLVSGSLGSDRRWTRFGGRVARLNVHSAMALPLIARDTVVGALNVYAHERDAFTAHAVALAERFAVPAAVAVSNIQLLHEARSRATHLQSALVNRAVIDQAIGILRSRSGITADEAFDRLKSVSQGQNIKLAVVASRLVDEAVRGARARIARTE